MANHKSALKRARQSEDRRLRNRSRKTRMKNVIRSLEEAISAKSVDQVRDKLQAAISIIDTTASKGVIHRNTASRKVSRLTKKANAFMNAQSA